MSVTAFTSPTDKKYHWCYTGRLINCRNKFDHIVLCRWQKMATLGLMISNVQAQLPLTKVCVAIRFHTPFASHTDTYCSSVSLSQLQLTRVHFYYLANKLVAVLFGSSMRFLVMMWASIVLLLLNPRKLPEKEVKGQKSTVFELCGSVHSWLHEGAYIMNPMLSHVKSNLKVLFRHHYSSWETSVLVNH